MKKIFVIAILCLIASVGVAQSTNTFEYDNLNRLTKVTYANGVEVQYTYDAVGNRLSKTVGDGSYQQLAVTTSSVTQVGTTTATCGGNVTADGGATVTARGVCWGTSHNPTVVDAHTSDGTGIGVFTSDITGLMPNTTYYVRAYAVNSEGMAYGEEVSFTTATSAPTVIIDDKSCPSTPTVTDHEGNVYSTVQIGNQCWMRENLRTSTSPSTGTYLISPMDADGSYAGKQAFWYNNYSDTYFYNLYNYDPATHASSYGLLYNWNAAMDTYNAAYGETGVNTNSSSAVLLNYTGNRRGICPAGWHLPSDAEWNMMERTVSGSDWQTEYETSGFCRGSYACKLTGGDSWIYTLIPGNPGYYSDTNRNASGFSAVAAGMGYSSSNQSLAGLRAALWSSSDANSTHSAYARSISYRDACVDRVLLEKIQGLSVRCVQNEDGFSVTPPTITTGTVNNITGISAICGGNVTDDGGATVTRRGVCWSISQNPTINDDYTTDGHDIGSFISYITGLTPDMTYYVRAYATNSEGTTYGEQMTFTTLCDAVNLTVSGKTTICEDESTTLTASGADSYQWSSGQNSSSITITPAVTTTYTVSGTDQYGCTKNFSVTIDVIAPPIVNITGATNISIGQSTTLTASTADSYYWSTGNTGPSITVSPSATITYMVTAYNSYGCTATTNITVTVPATDSLADGQPCPGIHTITDIDGNLYNTVKIGNQCWMRENLRTTRYADNTPIEQGSDNSYSVTTPYRYYPSNNGIGIGAYGYLYNWAAVMNDAVASNMNPSGVQGICPDGWHVPSSSEWTQLSDYVSSKDLFTCGWYGCIAKALSSTEGWGSCSYECSPGNQSVYVNNATGFSAIPVDSNYANFWSTTTSGNAGVDYFSICSQYVNTLIGTNGKASRYSVRCIHSESITAATLPSVITGAVSDIMATTATCGGNVTADGGATVTARGVCWGTSQNPTVTDAHTSNGTGTGAFISQLSGLQPNTTYHVRAYATNSEGTAYGEEVTFTTLATIPTVTTSTVYNIMATTAICGGNVTYDGGATVTERGVCWSTSQNPTVTDAHTSNGTGTGAFISQLSGLQPNTTYHVRAYATNSKGTAYGEEVTFTTTCAQISIIIEDSVLCEGGSMLFATIVSADAPYSEILYTWYKDNVIIANESSNQLIASETGSYKVAVSIDGCSTESAEVYVNERSAPQLQLIVPETDILIGDVTTIMADANDFNGDDFLYSWSNGHTGSTYTFVPDQIGPFIFDVTVTNILTGCEGTASVTINVHDESSRYNCGDDLIVNGVIYSTQQYGSQCWMTRNLRNDSGSEYYSWSAASQACPNGWHLPTQGDWETLASYVDNNSGQDSNIPLFFENASGEFWMDYTMVWGDLTLAGFCNISGQTINTFYGMYDVYDAEENGVIVLTRCLRDENAFVMLPIVTTDTVSNIMGTTAICGGNVTADGGTEVTERGVCWSTSSNPTVVVTGMGLGTGTGTFTVNLTELNPGITYHVRAYATNSAGTAYGEEVTFTTTGCAPIPIVIGDSVLCEGGSMLFATIASAVAPHSEILYTWYKDNVIIANESSNQLLASETGSYKVAVSIDGCSSESAEVYVNERSTPQLQLTVTETDIFIGDATTITADANDFNGDDFLYSWPDGYSGSTYTFVPDHIGSVAIEVTATNTLTGCEGTASITVNVHGESSRYNCGDDLIVNGVIYSTQQYGSQCWMTRNLRDDSGSEYYSWSAAKQACPNGWHLPTQGDWETLASYVDNNSGQDSNIPLFFENASGEFWMDYTMPWGNDAFALPCYISGQTINVNYGVGYETNQTGMLVLTRCLRDENASAVLPTVTTAAVSNITDDSAICGGNVTADGGTEVMERGVCWSSSSNPTIIVAGSGTGTFTVNLTDLNPGITYHVRAYATNSAGTAYGEEVTFTTAAGDIPIVNGQPCPGTPTVTDIDGNVYNTVQIGSQCWTKENLRVAAGTSGADYASNTTPYYYIPQSPNTYGYYYNWPAAMMACPSGWHLPSNEEYTELAQYVGSQSNFTCGGNASYIAKALASPTGWNNSEYGYDGGVYGSECTPGDQSLMVNNATGFSAVPAGICSYGSVYDANYICGFWTSTEYGTNYAYSRGLGYSETDLGENTEINRSYGYSVRCLRNDSITASLPSVTTGNVSDITASTATCGGNVTSDGGATVTERGICWSTSQNPTVNDSHTTNGTGTGSFTSNITGLSPSTTYYVRAYATNSEGTVYGEEVTFTTANGCIGISIAITGNDNVCETESVVLTANVSADGFTPDNLHYTWYESGQIRDNMTFGLGDSNVYSEYLYPRTEPYLFSVEVYYGAGCVAQSGEYLVYVHPMPEVIVSASETAICEGGEVTLSISCNDYNNPMIIYMWYRNGVVIPGATQPTITDIPSAGNNIYTGVASLHGCSASDQITIHVNDLPETPVVTVNQATVFDGGQVTLTVTNPVDGALYTWYRNGMLIEGATQATLVDMPMTIDGEATTYAYNVMAALNNSGCVSEISGNTEVAVFPTPVANVTVNGNTTFCEGSSTTLHVDVTPQNGPTYSYQWYKDDVPIPGATSADYVVAEPARTTSYNFHVVVSANGSDNVTAYAPAVTVVSSPTVVASISESTVCAGGTATLTALVSGGVAGINGLNNYSYQWFRNVDSTTELVSTDYAYTTAGDESAGTYTYWVAISNDYGCNSQSESVMFTVANDPTVIITPAAGYDATVCEGGSTAIQAVVSGGYGTPLYQWFKNGLLLPNETGTVLHIHDLMANAGDVYAVSVVQEGSSCGSGLVSAAISSLVTVNAPATVILGDSIMCEGGSMLFALTIPEADSDAQPVYTWFKDDQPMDIVSSDYILASDPGLYKVAVSVNGCTSESEEYYVTYHSSPQLQLSATETDICVGGHTAIFADVVNWSDGTILYSWSDSYGSGSSYDFSSEQAGLHTITVTATNTASGCQGTNSITINVNDLPETPVVTVNQATVFDGGQVTLTVTNPVDGALYTWYRNGMLIEGATQATLVDMPMTIDGEATTYAYNVMAVLNNSGCVSEISGNTEVTVFPLPRATVSVAGDTMLCEGGSTTLQVNVVPANNPSYIYQWYEDGALIPGATMPDYVVTKPARDNAYNFSVMVSDTNGGFFLTSDAPAITVVPSPTVVASISESTICVGGTATLTAMVEGGVAGVNGYNFQWYGIAGTSTPRSEVVGTGSSYTTSGDEPAGNYPYWVMVSDEYGCSSQSGMVILAVVSQPAVTITRTVGYGEMVCEGGSTAIQANVTGGYGECSYQWYANGYILPDETNQSLAINNLAFGVNDTYTVVVAQTGAGCSNSASADINTLVSVYHSYTVAVSGPNEICEGGDLTMFAEVNNVIPGNVLSYQWHEIMSGQDILIEGANSIMYTAADLQSGSLYEYYVVVNSSIPSCSATSSAYMVNVNALSHNNLYETSCEYYTWNDTTYSESGEYTQTYTNAAGCDSIVTLHLTVNTPTEGDTTAIVSGSFSWYEYSDLTQSGDYIHTLTNSAGCDSIVTLHLTVNAQWQVDSYDLNVNQVTGGTITMTVSYVDETSPGTVNSFSTTTDTSAIFESWIQLSADADYGYDFVDFLVITASGDTLETPNNGFTMPAENVTVTAVFTLHNFNITVNVSDETPWGTVTGSGSFAYGSTDTLTAAPMDEHHIFVGWSDYNTENPRVITVTQDSTITAYFVPEEIEIIGNDTVMGSVSVNILGGGHLTPNTPIVITATPEPHYHFVSWSDGNTDNPRTIFPIQAIGLTAVFAIDQHTITVLSNDYTWGEVIGGGIYDYGTEISICANALAGYEFLTWGDGNTDNPRHITVEQDSTFTAIFQIQNGINDANMSNVSVYSYENQVVVANAEGFSVEIFDMSGRLVISENNVSQSIRKYIIATDGIYLVKVGNNVFKKVKIAR